MSAPPPRLLFDDFELRLDSGELEQRIQKRLQSGPLDPFLQAQNAMFLGEPGRALDLLTRQCAPQGMWLTFAAVDPVFDDLRSDPRWGQVLDCLKLPADAPARRAFASRQG